MIHVGIDLHRDSCQLRATDDETGELLLDLEVPSERDAMLESLLPLQGRADMRLVMEACGFAGYWADVLDPLGEVVVVHPKHVKPFRTGKCKTDRKDAALLVKLSQLDHLPRAYIGTTAERDLKDLLRYRVGLVQVQTRLRVRLRNVAQRYGTVLAATDVDSPKGRRLWREFPLRETHRLMVDQLLEVLAEVEGRLAPLEAIIAQRAVKNRTAELFDTLPGIGLFGGLLAAAEVGDWRRFHQPTSLANFAGLVPSEDSSAERVSRGPITKEGSRYLRWIMVQAALKCEGSPRLFALYERVRERRGKMKARVAVARELLVIAWHLLHQDRPYEERRPRESGGQYAKGVNQRSGQLVGPLTH